MLTQGRLATRSLVAVDCCKFWRPCGKAAVRPAAPNSLCLQPHFRKQTGASVPSRTGSYVIQAMSGDGSSVKGDVTVSLQYKHVLLAVLDANPYLSDGSRQALATAAELSQLHKGRVTVLVIEEPGTDAGSNANKAKLDNINWHLGDRGCLQFEILEKSITLPASVLVGDVADELKADLLILSSEAVHSRYVDANQLAEFVPCPVLLLP